MKKLFLIFCALVAVVCTAIAFTACGGAEELYHTHVMKRVDAKESNCFKEGNIEYFICSSCGKWYEDYYGYYEITDETKVIVPKSHTLKHVDGIAATCTTEGRSFYYSCDNCGKWFKDINGKNEITDKNSIIIPITHKLSKVKATAATCTLDGNIEYYTCSACDKWFKDANGKTEISDKSSVVLAKGHKLTQIKAVSPTCKKEGNIAYYGCTECKKLFSDDKAVNEITDKSSVIVKRLPHDYDDKVCKKCGIHEPTEGLEYYDYGDYYYLSGIGSATDSVIYIADYYNGKPVKVIHELALRNCSSITDIIIPDGITYIDEYAFVDCTSLKNVVIPYSVTRIDNSVFSGCSGLESIDIPNSVTQIGSYLFANCTSLKSVRLSGNITSLDTNVFNHCSNLSDIYFNGTLRQWNNVYRRDNWDDDIGEYTVHCTDTSYTAGHKLTLIKAKAATCTEDGNEEYYACEYCDRWFEDEDAKAEIANKNSFIHTKLGHDMTHIEEKAATCLEKGHTAYYSCGNCNKWFEDGEGKVEIVNKTTVNIKKLPHSYENKVCTRCGTNKLEPTEGLLYEDKGDYAEFVGLGTAEGDLIIADEYNGKPVTSIKANAINWSSAPTSIVIPDSVTHIGDGAFQGCSSITSITISENITEIGKSVFYGCGITSIVIPDSVTVIGESAFAHCDKLTSIVIPDNVTTIGKSAFSWCSYLTSVTIGTGVTTIGEFAFERCYGLKSIVIPENVTSIGNSAFESCSGLRSVTLTKNITSFGTKVFEYCSVLADIYFDGTYDEWHDMTLRGSLGFIRSNYYIHCTDGDFYVKYVA